MRENEILEWLARQASAHKQVPIGIGDDMAAVRLDADGGEALALLKVDQALDQVHFDLPVCGPRAAGRKAALRCLSDCAAMACLPAAMLLSVALPRGCDAAFARELLAGAQSAAEAFDCPLVGGDTSIWDQRLVITVILLGKTQGIPPVRRDGAQPGDLILVTGALGGSILGRHLDFTPRIHLARRLAAAAPIHAMMDLSDGLAMDLPRLVRRSAHHGPLGARVDLNALPVHADALKRAQGDQRLARQYALADGEDYELLLTAAPGNLAALQAAAAGPDAAPLTPIGQITATAGLELVEEQGRRPWPAGGWEHQ